MNKFKRFIANRFFKELLPSGEPVKDAGSTGGATGRELASEFVKTVVYKTTSGSDYEEPDFTMSDIESAYDTDSYIRQGVDKYVDQIFKEGYSIYSTDTNASDYINQRLAYIAEATSNPTDQFFIDIAEDIVKYGNAMIVKSRNSDPNALPQGVNAVGLNGKDPIVGYYCANPSTMTCQRDDYGTITEWKQKTDVNEQTFAPEDVVHFYYKRKKGNAYGTSFLVPVLDDVRALRQAEENVLKMMYRNIYPFQHVIVGTEEEPGKESEVEKMSTALDDMEVDGGVVTTERVEIKAIATDKVINAEPYLRYMEQRVFSGMGMSDIMFGRGGTSNRSTSDNITSEMADRIRAIHKLMETFINDFIFKELLMEGGYDPVLNPDQKVYFKFNDNEIDVMIKKEVHAIYKYEHNAITEDEMRKLLGMDPVSDEGRSLMYEAIITQPNLYIEYGDKMAETGGSSSATTSGGGTKKSSSTGTAETNNKSKNGGGNGQGNKKSSSSSTKSTPNKSASKAAASIEPAKIGLIKDEINNLNDELEKYIKNCYNNNVAILQHEIDRIITKHMALVGKDFTSQDEIVKACCKISRDIHEDLVHLSKQEDSVSNTLDLINTRVSIFKDSILSSLKT